MGSKVGAVSGTPAGDEELAATLRTLSGPEPIPVDVAAIVERAMAEHPKALASFIPRLVQLMYCEEQAVAQACARALPALTKVTPAKVGKHIATLSDGFIGASDTAKQGTVDTFVGLSAASVAYQKRVIGTLVAALREAELDIMVSWATAMLPTLKGEPYAAARSQVEARLAQMPRQQGQEIARRLGITYRGRPVPG
ncbi:MAG: hypothetical protein OXU20_16350 [Myxococcales bacterium]|nr:hypothetical protein [Myxococcales bacterium]